MKITLAELVTILSYDIDADSMKKNEQALKQIQSKAQSVAGTLATVGAGLTAAITLPFLAFSGYAVKAAGDAEAAGARFDQIFTKFPDRAAAAVKRLSDQYDLSRRKSRDLITDTTLFLGNFGLGEKQAIDVSERVAKISADLAAFKNLEGGAAQAAMMVRRALAGQTRGLVSLGIVIKQEEVKQRVATDAANGHVYATQRQAVAMATLALLTERARKVDGYYAKNREKFNILLDRFHDRVEDLGQSFGAILLPYAERALAAINRFLSALDKTSPGFKTMILLVGALGAVIGPILLAMASFVGLLGFVAKGIQAFNGAMGLTYLELAPFIAAILGSVAAMAAMFLILQDIYTYLNGGDSVFGRFFGNLNKWGQALNFVLNPIASIMQRIYDLALGVNAENIGDIAARASSAINRVGGIQGQGIGGPPSITGGARAIQQTNHVSIDVDARGSSPTDTAEAVSSGTQSGLGNVLRQGLANFLGVGDY